MVTASISASQGKSAEGNRSEWRAQGNTRKMTEEKKTVGFIATETYLTAAHCDPQGAPRSVVQPAWRRSSEITVLHTVKGKLDLLQENLTQSQAAVKA